MSFTARPCADLGEYGLAILGVGQYFGMELDAEADARFTRVLPIDRMHAAFEGTEIVGGAGAFPFELSTPGGSVRTAGVTVVGTYPTHRRRGVLRALMRAQIDDVHERDEPLAALWASAETIYGRFGYGIAGFCGSVDVATEHTGFAAPDRREGRLRLVEQGEALQLFPRVWEAVRRRTPGMIRRSRAWWETRILRDRGGEGGAGPKRLVVYERAGRPEGYAIYRHRQELQDDGVSIGEIKILEAIAHDGVPTEEVWRYLLSIDWTSRFTARLLPPDHALFFLLATPRRLRYRMSDGLWVRLVDVGAALSARRYASDGAVVVDVADPFCPWNEGRWRVADGAAKRTRAAAQLRCDVTALGSVYLGGVTFSQLVRAGRVEELRRGAATRADAMFAAERHPWCPEIF
jgi:predicted acetyltransferase